MLLHEAPDISIHALREEGDLVHSRSSQFQQISIHALREEGDINYVSQTGARIKFLSTPSARRATSTSHRMQDRQKISIHALREEGDYRHHGRRSSGAISIHALREEGDLPVKPKRRGDVKFLSTPSARRATKLIPTYSPDIAISIHALREEGDDNRLEYEVVGHGFLSTPSARRATRAAIKQLEADIISIHALREEGDAMAGGSRSSGRNFYPRPPRGGRLGAAAQIGEGKVDFYPRPPRGGRPGGGVLRAWIEIKRGHDSERPV